MNNYPQVRPLLIKTVFNVSVWGLPARVPCSLVQYQ